MFFLFFATSLISLIMKKKIHHVTTVMYIQVQLLHWTFLYYYISPGMVKTMLYIV